MLVCTPMTNNVRMPRSRSCWMIGVVVLAATWSAVELPSSARDVPGDAGTTPRRSLGDLVHDN